MSQNTIFVDGEDLGIKEALEILTDEFIESGGYCRQTVIDLREALKDRFFIKNPVVFNQYSGPVIWDDKTPRLGDFVD